MRVARPRGQADVGVGGQRAQRRRPAPPRRPPGRSPAAPAGAPRRRRGRARPARGPARRAGSGPAPPAAPGWRPGRRPRRRWRPPAGPARPRRAPRAGSRRRRASRRPGARPPPAADRPSGPWRTRVRAANAFRQTDGAVTARARAPQAFPSRSRPSRPGVVPVAVRVPPPRVRVQQRLPERGEVPLPVVLADVDPRGRPAAARAASGSARPPRRPAGAPRARRGSSARRPSAGSTPRSGAASVGSASIAAAVAASSARHASVPACSAPRWASWNGSAVLPSVRAQRVQHAERAAQPDRRDARAAPPEARPLGVPAGRPDQLRLGHREIGQLDVDGVAVAHAGGQPGSLDRAHPAGGQVELQHPGALRQRPPRPAPGPARGRRSRTGWCRAVGGRRTDRPARRRCHRSAPPTPRTARRAPRAAPASARMASASVCPSASRASGRSARPQASSRSQRGRSPRAGQRQLEGTGLLHPAQPLHGGRRSDIAPVVGGGGRQHNRRSTRYRGGHALEPGPRITGRGPAVTAMSATSALVVAEGVVAGCWSA